MTTAALETSASKSTLPAVDALCLSILSSTDALLSCSERGRLLLVRAVITLVIKMATFFPRTTIWVFRLTQMVGPMTWTSMALAMMTLSFLMTMQKGLKTEMWFSLRKSANVPQAGVSLEWVVAW